MERRSLCDCIRSENRQPMTHKINNDVAGCLSRQCPRASNCLRYLGAKNRSAEDGREYAQIAPDPETCDLFVPAKAD
jgi:hypothetical protein